MGRQIRPLSAFLFVADIVTVLVSLAIATVLRSRLPFGRGGVLTAEQTLVPWQVFLLAALAWSVALVTSGAYDPQLSLRWYKEAVRVVWGSVLATVLMAGVLYMTYRELSRLQFIYFFVLATLFILGLRAGLRVYYRLLGRTRPGGRSRILILGVGELGHRVAKVLLDHSRWGFHPVGFLDRRHPEGENQLEGLPVLGGLADLQQTVVDRSIDEIWVALPADSLEILGEIIAQVESLPVRIKIVPDYFSYALIQTKAEVLADLPVIGIRDPLIEGLPRLIKRGFDILIAGLLLILISPALLLIWLVIKLDSPGPGIFRQQRVGENGRLFDMLKFRTMVSDAQDRMDEIVTTDDSGDVIHKRQDDPRVTRLGRWLRHYSLDELPQLVNVLKGEMSMVGPRPELPWLVDHYDSWQRKRFAVPQGITGWWQINGRSDRPMHLNTEDDLYYVYNYSMWLDIQILLRTPWEVIRGRGAF
jgi:exopolysaccharide biosynthesis polyprenyl glycosylphosphotransferase